MKKFQVENWFQSIMFDGKILQNIMFTENNFESKIGINKLIEKIKSKVTCSAVTNFFLMLSQLSYLVLFTRKYANTVLSLLQSVNFSLSFSPNLP